MGSRFTRIDKVSGTIGWFVNTSKGIRLKATVNIIVGLVIVFIDIAYIWVTKIIVDSATGQSHRPLWVGCSMLAAIAILNITLAFSRRWIAAILGVKSQNMMQLRTFSRLMHSTWNGKEQRHSGDVMNRLIRDANEVTSVITDTFPSFICMLFRLTAAFIYLYCFDARLACIIICISPIFLILSKIYVRKMRILTREIRDTDSRIQSTLQESIQHRMVIKTLERTNDMISRLAETQTQLLGQIRHKTIFSSTSALILNTGFSAGFLITFIWGAYSLSQGAISYGTLLAFTALVGQIQGPVRDLTNYIPVLINALTAAQRLQELEETPLEDENNPTMLGYGVGIRMENVSYRYTNGHRDILRNFSFDFRPGSTTALIGETGAGKTTLIRMILALLTPTGGSVKFYKNTPDGATLNYTASPATRCNLVYVPQGNTLFSGTIRDNLLLGKPSASDEELRDAINMACADFVYKMKDGLNTTCGEGGTGLSEGQAQRIAIARALLRSGSILLLDEATSALDPETENRLMQNISTEARKKHQTIVYITHRPTVLDYCEASVQLERL